MHDSTGTSFSVAKGYTDVLITPGKWELLEEGNKTTMTMFVSKNLVWGFAKAVRWALPAGRVCWNIRSRDSATATCLQPFVPGKGCTCSPGFAPATERPWPFHLLYTG